MSRATVTIRGVEIHSGFLSRAAQIAICSDVSCLLAQAPLVEPITPRGTPMSVRMSAAGEFGWITDRGGYRYERTHPNGVAWPEIPDTVLAVWNALCPLARAPESCLINWYGPRARMGLHQDRDEADFTQPVLSISLGDDALFRIGNGTRGGKTESVWLSSGDVAVLGGEARLLYHGIDRVRPGTSTIWPDGGRVNLTLRVVT